ncbi:hypothetical protein KP509_07G028000 [Ceratopteris richardii]|nr:hypothetical protein KP509_07G028000 [Ceratopteris richardii]
MERSGTNDMKWASVLRLFESNYFMRVGLLTMVLLGTCMAIGAGVVTPSISVFSAVSGINGHHIIDKQCFEVLLTCILLVSLFCLQPYGTHRVAFLFAPIVILWLVTISLIGFYNIMKWNPTIIRAVLPQYMYNFMILSGIQGWLSFGGIVLCITGTEAMFANLGHFSPLSVKMAFAGVVYPCVVLSYMGQAAFLSKNEGKIFQSFYKSIPDSINCPVVVVAILASVVASQSVISATFSIINQCRAMGCFPYVKVVHTSNNIIGQIYIPEINWMLMLLSVSVTLGLRDTGLIGNAYGLAVTTVMLVTTLLMCLVVIMVWRKRSFLAFALLLVSGSLEGLFFSASLIKVPKGGWVPLALALLFMAIMSIWHYGTTKKYEFEAENKVSVKQILSLGPGLGMVRVPGVGLVYSNLVTGIPSIFSHFVTNIPAFHEVLVFVCIKSVQVPYVPQKERFLVGRIGPIVYMMFRCIVRYGYKDLEEEGPKFEEMLVHSIEEFIRLESIWEDIEDGHSMNGMDGMNATIPENEDTYPSEIAHSTIHLDDGRIDLSAHLSFQAAASPSSASSKDTRNSSISSIRKGSFGKSVFKEVPNLKGGEDRAQVLRDARASGITYVLGRSVVRASQNSSLLKRAVINHAYFFLKENFRSPALALHVPHNCLIRVGMVYYV